MMVRDLPAGTIWSAAGIGQCQLAMNAMAIAMEGGVRVGLEDNIWYDRGRDRLASNLELLERVNRLAEIHERPLMSARAARELLGLEPGNGRYGRVYP